MNDKFMQQALKEANKAKLKDEVPIGCVIVYQDKIIARAHNTKEYSQQAIDHAEIRAIRKANKKLGSWRLDECTLYVTLEPCPMCAGAIMQSRIKKVVFGASDPKGGSYGSTINMSEVKGLNHYPTIVKGVMEKESEILLKDFFKLKRITKKQQ